MANLYFPQLTSGALAQYPIQKTRVVPTIKNVLPDGNLVLFTELNSNPHAARLMWQLSYSGLGLVDLQALQAHYANCRGPFRGFTFIDPTDNMFFWSSDLTAQNWQRNGMQISSGASDPDGGSGAFVLTNASQASQAVVQTLSVPANYRYCMSAYVMSAASGTVLLTRSGASASESSVVNVGPSWTRVASSGQLNDAGTEFTAGIVLVPGQQITVYGMQLEAQMQPSRFRATGATAGVYPTAHWGSDELAITAEAPNLFSTSFSIETNL